MILALVFTAELTIGLGLFGSGSGRAWILKNCRASIGPDAEATGQTGSDRNHQFSKMIVIVSSLLN